MWTTVNGDCDMRPGDLVLTPSWNWHDHVNGGDTEMYWFDGLDLPIGTGRGLLRALPGAGREPARAGRAQRLGAGAQRRRPLCRRCGRRPLTPSPSPLLIYRWADAAVELDRRAASSDDPSVALEYVNPITGASVLPTLGCAVQRVRAGGRTAAVRRLGNAVYVVYQRTGSTVIDGQRFDWGPGDMFVAPSWSAVEHLAEEQADLFLLTDAPVLRALGIYREQVLPGPQAVTGVFTPLNWRTREAGPLRRQPPRGRHHLRRR